ncbi:MAG: hypothetical protein ACRCTG_16780 [Aestuariivirga sp.]
MIDRNKTLDLMREAGFNSEDHYAIVEMLLRFAALVAAEVGTEATDALMQQMTGEPGKVALFTHPQPKREPLTDAQLKAIINKIDRDEQYIQPALRQLARAIEACHGIGGEK